MLDSLYQTLFRPRQPLLPLTVTTGWVLVLLLSLLTGLAWAGRLGLGAAGMVLATLTCAGIYLLAWFFLSAATTLLAELQGGQGSGPETMGAIAAAFWPALLFGPLSALSDRFDRLSGILGLVVSLWIVVSLVRAVAQAHRLSLARASVCVFGAGLLAVMGLGALIGTPLLFMALFIVS